MSIRQNFLKKIRKEKESEYITPTTSTTISLYSFKISSPMEDRVINILGSSLQETNDIVLSFIGGKNYTIVERGKIGGNIDIISDNVLRKINQEYMENFYKREEKLMNDRKVEEEKGIGQIENSENLGESMLPNSEVTTRKPNPSNVLMSR